MGIDEYNETKDSVLIEQNVNRVASHMMDGVNSHPADEFLTYMQEHPEYFGEYSDSLQKQLEDRVEYNKKNIKRIYR